VFEQQPWQPGAPLTTPEQSDIGFTGVARAGRSERGWYHRRRYFSQQASSIRCCVFLLVGDTWCHVFRFVVVVFVGARALLQRATAGAHDCGDQSHGCGIGFRRGAGALANDRRSGRNWYQRFQCARIAAVVSVVSKQHSGFLTSVAHLQNFVDFSCPFVCFLSSPFELA
jgi:hypothetical protein